MLYYFLCIAASAQSTKVKGRVTDAETGEGIPFAGIVFQGSTIGVSADLDGYYTLETRDTSAHILTAQMVGYVTEEHPVQQHSFNEINFSLHLSDENRLSGATVKPDNRKAKRLLAGIERFRSRNNPEKYEEFQCEVYTKMELDMTNAEQQLRNKALRKQIGFVFEYMDTSAISGQPYLPVMISETVSDKFHSLEPAYDREVVKATKISGIDQTNNNISQYTASLYVKVNFYENFISAFNISLPSPLGTNGDNYYNYYIIDSLKVDGRKTYQVRFHPRKYISSPAMDGEMLIDAEDYGLRSIHTRLKKGSNVNWVRDFVIDIENQRIGDSTWFYKHDKMYIDFSLTQRDSSKMISFLGNRELHYSKVSLDLPDAVDKLKKDYKITVQKEAARRDTAYWNAARPYALSQKEKNIYVMVDSVKQVPLYKSVYNIVSTLVNGYIDTKYVGFGPVLKLVSSNNIEGTRVQFGARTTAQFSRKIRFTGYGAYGFKDKDWKGGAEMELMFSKEPTRKLAAEMRSDITQLGKGSGSFAESSILTSILSRGGRHKMSQVNAYTLRYDHEFAPGINSALSLETHRVYSNKYVPMFTPDSTRVPSVAMHQAHFMTRFSWDESVTRGAFDKYYVSSDYPVLTVDLIGSIKGIAHNDYSYFRSELTCDYRAHLAPLGYANIHVNAGKIIGKVPYPLLKLHEGNGTYFLDRSSFSCMDYYEFASDTWVTLFYEHNFNGFFLGKIPLLRKMQLREVFTVKAAYGTLSRQNNGIIGDPDSKNAEMLFPNGMCSLNKPYIEAGFGVTNIFKVFRIDCAWRVTHRYNGIHKKSPYCFTATFGIELRF